MIVTFTGDISISGTFIKKIINDQEILSDKILNYLKSSDFTIGNLEGPTTETITFFNNYTPLKSPTNTILYLKKRNITIFNLANNHILDYGENGVRDTLLQIDKINCSSFGAGLNNSIAIKPAIIEKNGVYIGLFGITQCEPTKHRNAQLFSSDDFFILKKQINLYKNKVDHIIVNFHGGEEYSLYPSPVKRNFLRKISFIDGVTSVIAHHSHTFQGYESYKGKPIFYSLGNFIFDIPNHKPFIKTDESALLQFHFTKDNFTFSFLPFQIKKGKIVDIDKTIFIKHLEDLNDFSNYKTKWQKEAYRILFRKQNSLLRQSSKDKDSLQEKTFLKMLFSKEFYKKAIIILKDKYLFSLYMNAILYKLKK